MAMRLVGNFRVELVVDALAQKGFRTFGPNIPDAKAMRL